MHNEKGQRTNYPIPKKKHIFYMMRAKTPYTCIYQIEVFRKMLLCITFPGIMIQLVNACHVKVEAKSWSTVSPNKSNEYINSSITISGLEKV